MQGMARTHEGVLKVALYPKEYKMRFNKIGSSRKAGGLGASFLGAVRFHWAVEDR